jgi:hypothetical protein
MPSSWGRTTQVDTIVAKIPSSPVTCIVGPSDIGKSSVVKPASSRGCDAFEVRNRSSSPWRKCQFSAVHCYRRTLSC